jgi:hypothetical protein
MRSFLPTALLGLAVAASADAALTAIWRTNNVSGSSNSLTAYASVASLGAGQGTGATAAISPSISDVRYTSIFGDFVEGQTADPFIYKTLYNAQGRISQIVRYSASPSDPLANLRSNTGGEVFNFSGFGSTAGWDREDDMWADGQGNFYRNGTSGSGNNGVTRYTSFQDFLTNTNGQYFSYGTTYGWNDRFFAFEGKFYRTNTGGSGGSVSGFAVYNSFQDLLNRNVAQTINSNNWSAGDIFIPVPAPGALVLLGLAGFAARRRRA